jgi:hypothetical protein
VVLDIPRESHAVQAFDAARMEYGGVPVGT